MRIKILVLPFLVILSVVLMIGFIKPDYTALMEKRATLEQKEQQMAKVESVRSNIDSLNQELSTKADLETFVLRHHPETLDQERVIDSFNFMAAQSGLVIESMEMKEIIVEKPEESLGVGGPLTSVPLEGTPGMTPGIDGAVPTTPAFVPPQAASYVARVQAKGGYDNIKNFMTRLSRMDRVNGLVKLSINTDTEEATTTGEGEEKVPTTGQLIGTFEARFDYLPTPKEQNAISIPLFEQPSLAIGKLEEIRTWSNATVPTLTVGESGKANPFQ